MGVGVGSEDAGNHELGVRKLLAQHAHEGNRAALAHIARLAAKELLRSPLERLLQPRDERRRVPARGAQTGFKADRGAVGRVFLQQRFDARHGPVRIDRGRQTQRQLDCGQRPQDIPGLVERRQAGRAGDFELGTPGPVKQQSVVLARHRRGPGLKREHGRDGRAQHPGRSRGLTQAFVGDVGVQLRRQDFPRSLILQAAEHLAQHPEGGGHNPAGRPGMHPLGQGRNRQRAGYQTAQRVGDPQLVIVATPGIETDDQTR